MLVRQYGDTDFVTGLRGIAAFMVVTIHCSAFVDLGVLGQNVTDNGKYGVQIFFVISGYTIAVTYGSSLSFKAFLIRRLYRILPLYYVVMLLGFVGLWTGIFPRGYWMETYNVEPDFYNLVMHILVLTTWDPRITASIFSPEWTIPIEVFWYACLPVILGFTSRRIVYVGWFAALLVLAGITRLVADVYFPPNAAHFSALVYGPYFLMGAACVPMRKWVAINPMVRRRFVWAGAILFTVSLFGAIGAASALFGISTMLLIVGIAGTKRNILTIKPLLFLGSISYSIYLWHSVVIIIIANYFPNLTDDQGLHHFAIVSLITVALSTISYVAIERPTNRTGFVLATKLER